MMLQCLLINPALCASRFDAEHQQRSDDRLVSPFKSTYKEKNLKISEAPGCSSVIGTQFDLMASAGTADDACFSRIADNAISSTDRFRVSEMTDTTQECTAPPLHPDLWGTDYIDYQPFDIDDTSWNHFDLSEVDATSSTQDLDSLSSSSSTFQLAGLNEMGPLEEYINAIDEEKETFDPAKHTKIPSGVYGGWYYHIDTTLQDKRIVAERCAPLWNYDLRSRNGQNSCWKRLVKRITPSYAAAIIKAKDGDDCIRQIAFQTRPRTQDPRFLQLQAHHKQINDAKMKKTARAKYTRLAKIKSAEEGISLEDAFKIVTEKYKPQPGRGINNKHRGM